MRQFLRFCVVGTIGFLADSGILLALTQLMGLGAYGGRILSFLGAATITWYLNRRSTFGNRHASTARQWFTYIVVTSLGAVVNIGVYSLWLEMRNHSPGNLLLGVAFGSIAALFVNFFASKILVFAKSKSDIELTGLVGGPRTSASIAKIAIKRHAAQKEDIL